MGQLIHHGLGHLVTGATPDVDHLVVAFTDGDKAGRVLLLDFLDLCFGCRDQALLLGWHQHVIDADRNAGASGQAEAGLHQLVGEDYGFFQAAATEALVDQLGYLLLLERLVDDLERQAARQNLGKQGAARGC
jgi:hypothetical protein